MLLIGSMPRAAGLNGGFVVSGFLTWTTRPSEPAEFSMGLGCPTRSTKSGSRSRRRPRTGVLCRVPRRLWRPRASSLTGWVPRSVRRETGPGVTRDRVRMRHRKRKKVWVPFWGVCSRTRALKESCHQRRASSSRPYGNGGKRGFQVTFRSFVPLRSRSGSRPCLSGRAAFTAPPCSLGSGLAACAAERRG